MRAGRGAAVGVVAKGVDVEAALRVGVVARDVPGDLGGSRLGLLLEDDVTRDLGVTTEDSDCERRDELVHEPVTPVSAVVPDVTRARAHKTEGAEAAHQGPPCPSRDSLPRNPLKRVAGPGQA